MSLIVLYFLHNTSVLLFYIDVVLTLSIRNIKPYMLVKQHDIKVYLHWCGTSYHHLETALFKGLLVSVEPVCELSSSNDKTVFYDILQAERTYK